MSTKQTDTSKDSAMDDTIQLGPNERTALTEDELAEYCRSAVPALVQHTIDLALRSQKPRESLAVLAELLNRGYGKSVERVVVASPNDIKAAWQQLGNKPKPMLPADVVVITNSAVQPVHTGVAERVEFGVSMNDDIDGYTQPNGGHVQRYIDAVSAWDDK